MENNDFIVINKQELNTDYVKNRITEEKESKRDLNKAERIPVQSNIFLNPIFYTAVCGFITAAIVWGCVEPFVLGPGGQEQGLYLMIMILGMSLFLGCTISALEPLMSGNITKALKNGAIGLGAGLVWSILGSAILAPLVMGLIGGALQLMLPQVFRDLQNSPSNITIQIVIITMICRAPAWAIMGMGIGAIPGIASSSKKMLYNGLVGGLLGGFLGGFIFDPISYFTHTFSAGAGLSRGIGFSMLGLLTGFFVGLVENMAKDVWVTMKSGPLRGKQFVIYHNPTLIGSSPRSDIYIFKDPNVMPTHAKIQKRGSKYEIIDDSKGSGVYVNSVKINGSKILEHNDEIILGQSVLEFQQKEKR
jgi:hypothetical protein